jgi:hypothetical protein
MPLHVPEKTYHLYAAIRHVVACSCPWLCRLGRHQQHGLVREDTNHGWENSSTKLCFGIGRGFLTEVTITSDNAHRKLFFMELDCLRNPARRKTN